jgi:hypothetical protein
VESKQKVEMKRKSVASFFDFFGDDFTRIHGGADGVIDE